jgi:MoaA/NifB/PqqE/SkfB family radical SAM enzyme
VWNLARARLSAGLGTGRSLGLPANLFVEPTGRCTYRCVKCGRSSPRYRDDGPVGGGWEMPMPLFRRLLDEVGDTLVTLRLWHYGAPLLHPDLPGMVRIARSWGVFTAVSSTLSSLTAAIAGELVDAGLDYLVVSFDGGTRETYRRLHGADGFERAREGLVALLAARRGRGARRPFVELQTVVMKGNEGEIDAIRRIGAEAGVDKTTLVRLDDGDVGWGVHPGVERPEDLLPSRRDLRLDRAAIRAIPRCTLPWHTAVVRYSGLVLPCVTDLGQEYAMGRLSADSPPGAFAAIWNGAAFVAYRREVARSRATTGLCACCAQRDDHSLDQVGP